MDSKEFITKIIINPIKSLPKSVGRILPDGLISLFSTLPPTLIVNSGIAAYAQQQQQQQQQQALDPWSEALKTAQSKVETATSPGAFGHGVPDLYNITTQELLIAFGVTAIGALMVYAIISLLASRGKKAKRDQLLSISSSH